MASLNKGWECFAAQDLAGAAEKFGNACGYDYMACLFHYGLKFLINPDSLPFQVKITRGRPRPKISEEQRLVLQNEVPTRGELEEEEEDSEDGIYYPRVPLELIDACRAADAESCYGIGGIIMSALFVEATGIYPYRGRYEQLSKEEKDMEDRLFHAWLSGLMSGHRQF